MKKSPKKQVKKKLKKAPRKTMKQRVAEVLAKGREAIERFGWVQSEYGNRETGFCAIGAIRDCTMSEKLADMAVAELDKVVPRRYSYAYEYNDSGSCTKRKILNLFRKAEKNVLAS